MRLISVLLFLLIVPGIAVAQEGTIRVSDPFPVLLTYDRNGSDQTAEKTTTQKDNQKCGGGGLVGAMNCVTKKIEGAGSGGTEKTRETKTEGEDPISVEMRGTIKPILAELGNGRVKVTLQANISKPTFSVSSTKVPRDILLASLKDEAQIKLTLLKWSVIVDTSKLAGAGVQEYSFAEAFQGLQLLTLWAPKEQAVKLFMESKMCGPLQQQYLAAQADYLDALSTMPVLEKFELVTRTLDEVEEVFSANAKDLTDASGKIGKVTDKSPIEEKIEELMSKTKDLSGSVTDALGDVKDNIKREREALLKLTKLDKPLKDVKGGLEKASGKFKKVSETAAGLNQKVRKLEALFKATDASPSEQLKIFKNYFSEARDLVGGLVKAIPGLGVFLDLYAQAIEQISISAERIEAVVKDRNEQAKQLGIPSPYITLGNARERALRKQKQLYDRMQALAGRLQRECPGVDLSTESHGKYREMDEAIHRARSACHDKRPNMRDEWQARDIMRAAKQQAWKSNYERWRQKYRSSRSALENREKQLAAYQKIKSRLTRNQMRAIGNDIKAFLTEKRRSHEYNQVRLDLLQSRPLDRLLLIEYQQYLKNEASDVRHYYRLMKEGRADKQKYEAAKRNYETLRAKHKPYRACVKGYLRKLAQQKGWNPRLVRGLSSSSY